MRVNEEIQNSEVRLISNDGKMVGILAIANAVAMAEKLGFDLVEISPDDVPPVCKLMDYGKFLYDQKKRDKKKNHSDIIQTKELRVRPSTGQHDLDIKINHAREFLSKNKRVKFTLQFQGRETAHPELGSKMLNSIIEKLSDVSVVERGYDLTESMDDNMGILLSPKKVE
jgi:translation initiation factor IF-3